MNLFIFVFQIVGVLFSLRQDYDDAAWPEGITTANVN